MNISDQIIEESDLSNNSAIIYGDENFVFMMNPMLSFQDDEDEGSEYEYQYGMFSRKYYTLFFLLHKVLTKGR